MNYNDQNFVLLAMPERNDLIYRNSFNSIAKMYYELITLVSKFHKIVVLVDPYSCETLQSVGRIPRNVSFDVSFPRSIWVRDYFPVRGRGGLVKTKYQPSYISRGEAQSAEQWVRKWLADNKVGYRSLDLVIDGGNIIISPDFKTAILTERVFDDNSDLLRDRVAEMISESLEVDNVIIIPLEPNDPTGHADGMIRWINHDTILLNRYPTAFRTRLMNSLLPKLSSDIKIIEIPYAPSTDEYYNFPSAIGCYLNFLKTPKCCIVPSFSYAARDIEVFNIISQFCEVPQFDIESVSVARFGGVLNCISWN